MYQGKDQHIYYLNMLYFYRNLNLQHIQVYILRMDHQNTLFDKCMIQHHFFPYILHSIHKGKDYKDQLVFLLVAVL